MTAEQRPRLKIAFSPLERFIEGICTGVLIALLVFLFFLWNTIPENIPTHFNASGAADDWSGKDTLIFLYLVVLFIYIMLSVLVRIPHIYNYPTTITQENAQFQYRNMRMLLLLMKLELILLFTYIGWAMIHGAQGKSLGIWFLPTALVIFFATLVFFIIRSVRKK